MTRFSKLEETFNLDSFNIVSADDLVETDYLPDDRQTDQEIETAIAQADVLEEQFKQLRGRDVHDREMDDIAELAIQAHKDLRDLGMSVEVRHAGEIFTSSSQMLKIGLDAKNSKIDKKLKLLKLQLDKLRLEKSTVKGEDAAIDGNATMIDRNDLLAQVREEMQQIQNKTV